MTLQAGNSDTPLIVDLDGTLVRTDTLWESVIGVLRRRPWAAFLLPIYLFGGRAKFKQRIASMADFEPADLPYQDSVLAILKEARSEDRTIILATAADSKIANDVAEHLNCFDEVLASDGIVNLKSDRKLTAILERVGNKQFDYIGDAFADIPIWKRARCAYAVEPNARLLRKMPELVVIGKPRKLSILTIARQMRLHQWAKNLLIFIPILFAHEFGEPQKITAAALAFLSFGLCASATYVWNDLLDLPGDRQHKSKKRRPIASGALPIGQAVLISLFLLVLSFSIAALFLGKTIVAMLLGYIILTLTYSLFLKTKVMVDVLLLAGLYAYRIMFGGMATQTIVSQWLLAFSLFFFLSLAFVKRYADLIEAPAGKTGRIRGRGYYVVDIDIVRALGTASGMMSIVVLALFINAPEVVERYNSPGWLWLVCLGLLYWLARVWFLAQRGHMPDDPVIFAMTDRVSILVGAVMVTVVILAVF